MGEIESRLANIENFLHKVDSKFITARQKAEEISKGTRKPEDLGKASNLQIEQLVNAFLNSISEDTIKTLSREEKGSAKLAIKVLLEKLDKIDDKSLKQNLKARLKQTNEKL